MLVIVATWLTGGSKWTPWLLCIVFIVRATQIVPFSSGTHIFYREFNIYLYGSIKILNLALFLCDLKPGKSDFSKIMADSLIYFSYLPYSMTLIVRFEDFIQQFETWQKTTEICWNSVKCALWFGFRLVFWFGFIELILHFIHVQALFNSPDSLVNSLNSYEGLFRKTFFFPQFFLSFSFCNCLRGWPTIPCEIRGHFRSSCIFRGSGWFSTSATTYLHFQSVALFQNVEIFR